MRLHDWAFPHEYKHPGSQLWRLFEQTRTGMQDYVKAQASQMLILHALLRHLFTQRIGRIAALEPQLKSFCVACDCVDILLSVGGCLWSRWQRSCRALFGIICFATSPLTARSI